jgi:hypothetical protein
MKTTGPQARPGRFAPIRWVLALILIAILSVSAKAEQVVDYVYTLTVARAALPSWTGPLPPTQSFILTPAAVVPLSSVGPGPSAVVILLAGSDGNIQLTPASSPGPSDGTLAINSSNFLVRSRWLFGGQGFVVITLDSATDFQAAGGLTDQQGNPLHVDDVLQVIAWARTNYPGIPVWVIGTSRGTAGAFVAAGNPPPSLGGVGPDGLVFSSAINSPTDPDSLYMATLSSIVVPTLLVNNLDNTCPGTLVSGDLAVKKALKGAPKSALLNIGGGLFTALSTNCNALSPHGYFGVEPTTVRLISEWIKLY